MSFSALQRAENFSIIVNIEYTKPNARFSALQRAENFSIPRTITPVTDPKRVSVDFIKV